MTNPQSNPHPSRLSPNDSFYDQIIAAHEAAIVAGNDGYFDPQTSLFVITAPAHKTRGFCCENNCRHCPYI
ncbi:MAG: hypothetical protein HQ486_02200 [Acidimicrobiaceae bacterium]|nr:hypothetical protein [Acidimicrobiaceae bacterium]